MQKCYQSNCGQRGECNKMKTNAKITISRNINNINQIIISITDDDFKKDIDILIAPEQFALALTGLGYQDCIIDRQ